MTMLLKELLKLCHKMHKICKNDKKHSKEKIFNVGLHSVHAFAQKFNHKKGRTILTSVAGSIGIIGVALVLAISNGFTNYINKMQTDTLGGYPIAVSTVAIDYSSLSSFMGESNKVGTSEEEGLFGVYNPSTIIAKWATTTLFQTNL